MVKSIEAKITAKTKVFSISTKLLFYLIFSLFGLKYD